MASSAPRYANAGYAVRGGGIGSSSNGGHNGYGRPGGPSSSNGHGRQQARSPQPPRSPQPYGAGPASSSAHGSGNGGRFQGQGGNQDLGPYAHIDKGSAGLLGMRKGRAQGNKAPVVAVGATTGASLPPPKSNRFSMSSVSYVSHQSSAQDSKSYGTHSGTHVGTSYAAGPDANLLYDKDGVEADDYLHNPDGKKDKNPWVLCSSRGCANMTTMLLLFLALLTLFAGYPIISHYTDFKVGKMGGFNLGGSNGSGQVPDLNVFSMIDAETPADAQTWTNPVDQSTYHLVFSDEFNQEGRTFWPGDDPFWEAVDLWYGVTGDLEWYSPEAVNTTGGFLQITMSEDINHNLYFQSGMVQSWNKFCFQGGYIEFAAILPGSPTAAGYWPGLWTMGNLGRPGYPGSTDGMWPYSYNSCDDGILPNQTNVQGTGPELALHPSNGNRHFSYLPGMRTSACTCPGEDHPGPNVNVGRSSPELDVLEAQTAQGVGQASQSLQTAPYDESYQWNNGSDYVTLYNPDISKFNSYIGGVYQEAISGLTNIPDDAYDLAPTPRVVKFGAQYTPDWDGNGQGSVTWFIDGKATWTVHGTAIGPNADLNIGQRLIPVEPMAIIMNLGMSNGFQTIKWGTLNFPARFRIDHVRVYQPDGQDDRTSCDPPDHPTAAYIAAHPEVYLNRNLTIYPRDQYPWPKNKLTGC